MNYCLFLLIIGIGFVMVDGCVRVSNPPTTTIAPTTPKTTTKRITTTVAPTTQAPEDTTLEATTEAPIPCDALDTTSAGVTIGPGTTSDPAPTGFPAVQTANAHCTKCEAGNRNFYTSSTDSNSDNALNEGRIALIVNLPVTAPETGFCVCDANGVCCTPINVDPATGDSVRLIPYCDGGVCAMNVILNGGGTLTLECDDTPATTYVRDDQYDAMGDPFPMNTDAYFQAESVSTSGCDTIRRDVCMGPTLTGPA